MKNKNKASSNKYFRKEVASRNDVNYGNDEIDISGNDNVISKQPSLSSSLSSSPQNHLRRFQIASALENDKIFEEYTSRPYGSTSSLTDLSKLKSSNNELNQYKRKATKKKSSLSNFVPSLPTFQEPLSSMTSSASLIQVFFLKLWAKYLESLFDDLVTIKGFLAAKTLNKS